MIEYMVIPKLFLGSTRWLLPFLGWGVLTRGTTGSTAKRGVSSIASHEMFTVVDLHPAHGRTFHALVHAEVARARQRGESPFLELGGSGCGVCNALHKHLDARPLTPQVRATFAGTGIIRVAIEEWPDAQTAIGLRPDQRIPVYVALDTAGRVARSLSVDYWILRSLDVDTLNALQEFFRRYGGRSFPHGSDHRTIP